MIGSGTSCFVELMVRLVDASRRHAIMVVLGGMRNFWGPLLGAALYVVAQDYLSTLTDNWMSFVGLIFILAGVAFMTIRPRASSGIVRTA